MSATGPWMSRRVPVNTNDVGNMAKTFGQVLDIAQWCPGRDQKFWSYTGHRCVMSRIWPGIMAMFWTSYNDVQNMAKIFGHIPDIGHVPDINDVRNMARAAQGTWSDLSAILAWIDALSTNYPITPEPSPSASRPMGLLPESGPWACWKRKFWNTHPTTNRK